MPPVRRKTRALLERGALGCVLLAIASAWACVPEDPPGGPKRRPRLGVTVRTTESTRPPPASSVRPKTRALPPIEPGVGARDELLTEAFADEFERSAIGPDYRTTSSAWRISEGRLCATRAHNQPIWLARRLPPNARIEFDAVSGSAEGDIKVELWGDGESGARGTSYTDATSYLAIFGGWKNSLHVLARKDEHAKDRRELLLDAESDDPRNQTVEPGRRYHFRIERADGKTVRWFVDDVEILSLTDPEPLMGQGHDHVGFNDWETPVCFDNLDILPLD